MNRTRSFAVLAWLLFLTLSPATPAPPTAHAAGAGPSEYLYASVGAVLTQYLVDINNAELLAQRAVTFPFAVQYAWPDPSHKVLYVAWARRSGVDGPLGEQGVTAVRIDPRTGALSVLGQPLLLRKRPVHLSTDGPGKYLLIAHNNPPAGLTVYGLTPDGSIGDEVPQPGVVDGGIYAHQLTVDPTSKMAILVTRGNVPAEAPSHVEEPGALKVFSYKDGVLSNEVSIAPNNGFGFKPRHVDYSSRFVYLAVERQNQLQVYERLTNDSIAPLPKFTKTTLADPVHHNETLFPAQMVGPVHLSHNGRFVYLGNRNGGVGGVATDGENNIAVFSIDQQSGEPTLVQNADTHGFVPRTFTFDQAGRILIVSNQSAVRVTNPDGSMTTVPTSLAVFRMGTDGTLEYVRKYDNAGGTWAGMMPAP
jgi:6-phosphogluconolactonase